MQCDVLYIVMLCCLRRVLRDLAVYHHGLLPVQLLGHPSTHVLPLLHP